MRTSIFLSAICVVALGSASQGTKEISVWVDGTKVAFDSPPIQRGGRVLVPMRAVFQALDAQITWDSATRTIHAFKDGMDAATNHDVVLSLGDPKGTVNGKEVVLDVPPQLVHDRVMVPLRFIGEALGAYVKWNPSTAAVTISTFAPPK